MNPLVSVIIPCRNEKKYIAAFLNSVFANDYPIEKLEVLVIDGMSDDGTREILKEYASLYSNLRVIDNPDKVVPHAMNAGVRAAHGEIIVRLDAHAIYPTNYISQLVYYSIALDADNVGGSWETLPANDSIKARAIAEVLSHPFGVGNAEYRINSTNQEYIQTDTVPFGCYKKSVFDKIGLYDEDLIRNQDNELNERLLRSGGKIYLVPSVTIKYFARENFSKLWKMFYQYGYFGPLVDLKIGKRTRPRRYIPALFVLSLVIPSFLGLFNSLLFVPSIISLSLYLTVNMIASGKLAFEKKLPKLFPYLLAGFFIAHCSYGMGYLAGVLDFKILNKHLKKKINVNLSR